MNKTFKSVALPNVSVSIKKSSDGVRICSVHGLDVSNVTIAPSDAPAIALAVLEAAGVESPYFNLGDAVDNLRQHVEREAKHAAEAKDKAELEAEALELRNVYMSVIGRTETIWDLMSKEQRDIWLAVARKAREMAKEATK